MTKEMNAKVLDRFGLKRDPFDAPDAYSPVGKRHEILEQMVHITQFSNLVLAVIAPAGYGKTVLFRMLAKQLSSEKDLVITQFTLISRVSGMSLLQRLSEAWKLEAPSVNRETLLRQLRNEQLKRSTMGMRHCILIDNAEFIDSDGLQILQALTTGLPEDRSIGLSLFCHDNVVDLRSIFKPAESLHLIRLQPLAQRDVYGFIKDHFRLASARKGVAIPPEAIENIAVDSQGVPSKIVALTREYMVAQSGITMYDTGFQLTRTQRLAIALVGGAVLLGGLSFGIQSLFFNKTSIKPAVVESLPVPSATVEPPKTLLKPAVTDTAATPQPKPSQPAPSPVVVPVAPASQEAPPPVEQPAASPTPPAAPDSATAASEPSGPAKVVTATDSANPPKITVSNPVAEAPVQAVKTEPVQPKPAKTTAAMSRDWFINAKPSAFTIQILGSHQEIAVQAYIDGQQSPGDFDYVRTTLNGEAWYVVLYRVFDSKEQAAKLIPTLPESIRKQQPWVRTIGSIRPSN